MNGQKDTQKTSMNLYRHDNVSYDKSLPNMPINDFINKKTEKLVTALYMVTDCMDTDDALKGKLRLLGVELLSDIYKLATLSPLNKSNHTPVCLAHIYEILSFTEIAYTIGFISEMNTNILKKEFEGLASHLKSKQSKDKHFTFTLNSKMFEVPEIPASFNNKRTPIHNGYHLKDIASYQDKRTSFNNVSFINNQSPLSNNNNHNNIKSSTSLSDREDRNKRIVSIIKDMTASSSHTGQTDGSSSEANKDGVSIRDISLSFTDCSEKTIQRDLNALVSKGELKKVGSKRWSRYSLNSTPNNQ